MVATAWGLFRLTRPVNVVLFFAGVALGGVLAAGDSAFTGPRLAALVLAMTSAACIGAGANAVNDVYDLAIDRVNRPNRPLPSGQVSVRAAWRLWGVLSILGLAMAVGISLEHFAMAVGAVVALWAYSARFKRQPVWGNLVVAGILGLALLYGGLAVGPPGAAGVGALFAALTTLARELVKDLEDVVGDRGEGARTLPLVVGLGAARGVTVASIVVTLLALPLPVFVPGLGGPFLAYVLPAAGLLLAALWVLLTAPTATLPRAAGRASRLLKLTMVAGIVALALARLV